jgi:hypothetical protein
MGALAAVIAVAVTIATAGGSAANRPASAGVYTGYGFEACTAPSTAALNAWSVSPYRAVGIYLGGVNRACADGNLSASWVSTARSLGWSLIPLYVGLQAPCVGQARLQKLSSNTTTAASQGSAAADDAVSQAGRFGLGPGTPIYYDMEGYKSNDPACTKAVQSFVVSWHDELHALGFVSGVYGSAASTMRDVAALGTSRPDNAWIANWNGVEGVFGDPYVSDAIWTSHQRIHQYKGGHRETYAGVSINIDSDFVDGAVVGGGAPAPPPPPLPPAGSVGSGDGKATASWQPSSFAASAVVTLTPTAPPTTTPSGYGVRLTVTDTATSTPVTRFGAPVVVHLLMTTGGLAPSWSQDGINWTPLRHLASAALPAGVDAGYTLDPDGTIEIQTLVTASFGLLPDTVPPSQPQGFAGRFSKGSLLLQWLPATDNSGSISSYQVLLDGTPVSSLPADQLKVAVRGFHPGVQTVYRVRAVDPSGVQGKPTRPLVVRPTPRPANLPRALPHWAWDMLGWQHGHKGPRPAAAPHKLPGWYWAWADWRNAPFRLKR